MFFKNHFGCRVENGLRDKSRCRETSLKELMGSEVNMVTAGAEIIQERTNSLAAGRDVGNGEREQLQVRPRFLV